ncbi:MAG: HAD family acid phosphatase [Bacteriovoracia bacterium]
MIRVFFFLLLSLATLRAQAMPCELQLLVDRAAELSEGGVRPVVITDLDETIIDSTLRRYQALQQATFFHCGGYHQPDCHRLKGLNIEEFLSLKNRYDIEPLLDAIEFPAGPLRDQLLKSVFRSYLSGNFMELDQAIPGASELIHALQKAGADIYYVSSRSEKDQLPGTLQSLRTLEFLQKGEEQNVILRPEHMSSIEFKRRSFFQINEKTELLGGQVILVMENEPENMNAMTEIFPAAQAIFVDGAHLKDEPMLKPVKHLKNFR